MQTLKSILHLTEDSDTGKWFLSFLRPQFQGGESVEISLEDAKRIGELLK